MKTWCSILQIIVRRYSVICNFFSFQDSSSPIWENQNVICQHIIICMYIVFHSTSDDSPGFLWFSMVFQHLSPHPSLFEQALPRRVVPWSPAPREVLNFLFAGVVSSANGGILASQGRTSLSAKMATRRRTTQGRWRSGRRRDSYWVYMDVNYSYICGQILTIGYYRL